MASSINGNAFNWPKRVVLPVGLAVMETCWVYPWALLIGSWVGPEPAAPLLSAPTICAILILGRTLTRGALERDWPLSRSRIVLIALGVLTVLGAIRVNAYGHFEVSDVGWLLALGTAFSNTLDNLSAPVLATALGLFLWWRGIAYGRKDLAFEDVSGAFQLGIAALIGLVMAAVAVDPASHELLQTHVGAFVAGFFFFGLTSLALSSIDEIRTRHRRSDGRTLVFNRTWLVVVLAVVSTLLLVTLLLAEILAFDLIAKIAAPLLGLLAGIAWLLIYAVSVLAGYFVAATVFLLRLILRPDIAPFTPEPIDLSYLEQLQQGEMPPGLPPEVLLIAKWATIGIVGLVVVLLLARAISRWGDREQDDEVTEERDSVWNWYSLWIAVLAWLRELRLRLLAHTSTTASVSFAVSDTPAVAPLTLTVRQIYRQLLLLGASVGIRRASHQTPYEHLPRLQASIEPSTDVAAITEAYVRARYGLEVPPDAEVRDVQARWKRILASAGDADSASG